MLLPKKSYVIQSNQEDKFVFEFIQGTQEYYTKSLEEVIEEAKKLREDFRDEEEVEFAIYEVTLKRVTLCNF